MPENWVYWAVVTGIILLVLWGNWMKYRNSDGLEVFDI